MLAFLCPVDHYEWQPREIPNWIKKLFKREEEQHINDKL
jgi:hypothetical protein